MDEEKNFAEKDQGVHVGKLLLWQKRCNVVYNQILIGNIGQLYASTYSQIAILVASFVFA